MNYDNRKKKNLNIVDFKGLLHYINAHTKA